MSYGRAMRPTSNVIAVAESNEVRSASRRAGCYRPAPAYPVLGNAGRHLVGMRIPDLTRSDHCPMFALFFARRVRIRKRWHRALAQWLRE